MKKSQDNYYLELDFYQSNNNARRMLHSHCHPYYELSFIIEGDMTVLFDDKNYNITQPSVILSPPDTNHFVMVNGKIYHRYNIYFNEDVFESIPHYKLKLKEAFHSGGRVLAIKKDAVRRLKTYTELLKCEESGEGRAHLMALIINVLLSQDAVIVKQEKSYIDDVMRIILHEHGSRLVAEELASRFFVSRTKLMTDFKARTGKTLAEQITFVRVEQARAALKRGERVMPIAHKCGFGSAANFSRVFKKSTGMTPKEYQKKVCDENK